MADSNLRRRHHNNQVLLEGGLPPISSASTDCRPPFLFSSYRSEPSRPNCKSSKQPTVLLPSATG